MEGGGETAEDEEVMDRRVGTCTHTPGQTGEKGMEVRRDMELEELNLVFHYVPGTEEAEKANMNDDFPCRRGDGRVTLLGGHSVLRDREGVFFSQTGGIYSDGRSETWFHQRR